MRGGHISEVAAMTRKISVSSHAFSRPLHGRHQLNADALQSRGVGQRAIKGKKWLISCFL